MKYSAIVWPRIFSARATWIGSLAPRNVSAAICRAATQPSLRPCKRARSVGADPHAEVRQQGATFGQ